MQSDLRSKLDLLDGKIAQNENVITQMRDLQNKMKVSHHMIMTSLHDFCLWCCAKMFVSMYYFYVDHSANKWADFRVSRPVAVLSFFKLPLYRCDMDRKLFRNALFYYSRKTQNIRGAGFHFHLHFTHMWHCCRCHHQERFTMRAMSLKIVIGPTHSLKK